MNIRGAKKLLKVFKKMSDQRYESKVFLRAYLYEVRRICYILRDILLRTCFSSRNHFVYFSFVSPYVLLA